MLLRRLILATALMGCGVVAWGHEFWMMPERFDAAPGTSIDVALFVGEEFTGERVGITAPLVANFRRYGPGPRVDLMPSIPREQPAGHVAVQLPAAGSYLLAMDTHPVTLELPADKFNAYLEMEGLQHVMRARATSGATGRPGRERYRRNIKSLLRTADVPSAIHSVRTGQKLEIVPAADQRSFQVWFDGRALPDALVKFWSRDSGALAALQARTDGQGRVRMQLPHGGVWMVSVVHMVAAAPGSDFDWESYWGNLTFARRP